MHACVDLVDSNNHQNKVKKKHVCITSLMLVESCMPTLEINYSHKSHIDHIYSKVSVGH